jgi:hypothetical protein
MHGNMLRESPRLCLVQKRDGSVELRLDTIRTRLTREFGYSESGARIVAEKLIACSPQIKSAIAVWWNTGDLTDLEIEGFTVQRLMEQHGMKPIAAFLTLDWLVREPERARASLARGHDRVT